MTSLPKHEKYIKAYKPIDSFWGLGIENETYLQLGITEKKARFLKTNHQRERYSVDYWTIYKDNCENQIFTDWVNTLPEKEESLVKLPVLLNAHALLSTDAYGNHKTTQEREPNANPAFRGKTLYENLCEKNPTVFKDQKDQSWTFDGDTIEFMTQNFYKAKMEDVIDELMCLKRGWLEAFNAGIQTIDREPLLHTHFKFPTKNHGFALHLSNRYNLAIFNNGTYHFNITIPSHLGEDAKIADFDLFQTRHQAAARMFQWITPFLVAKFGSPEVLATLATTTVFPKGSQRLCASRYVSCGTYDTDTMIPGKILQIENKPGQHGWYDTIYDNPSIGYKRLERIGMDLNFHKHQNHGLEFRIFDEFPESELPNLFRLLIWMCDEALSGPQAENPKKNADWNKLLSTAVLEGRDAILREAECATFWAALNLPTPVPQSSPILDVYELLWETWCARWNASSGTCTELMIRTPLAKPKSDLTQNNTLLVKEREKEKEKKQEARITDPPKNAILLSPAIVATEKEPSLDQVAVVEPRTSVFCGGFFKWFAC